MMSATWDSTCVSGCVDVDWSDLITTSNYGTYKVSTAAYDDTSEDTLPDSYTEEEYKQFLKENGIEDI